jgi:O-antigen/teichoic acid export membrane protein
VAPRIAFKAFADAGGKAVMLVITVVAARRLNADPFGIMAFAMATGWLLGVATDAGLSMHLARETARHPHHGRRFLVETLSLRAGLAFLAATILVLATPNLVPRHWQVQFLLVVFAQLCGAMLETIAHYFRGLQRSEIESAIHLAHRLTTLVLAMAVLWWWRRLDYLGVALLVPGVIAVLVSLGIALQLSGAGLSRRSGLSAAEAESRPASARQASSGAVAPKRPSGREGGEPGAGSLTPANFFRNIFPLGAAVLISALYFRIDVYFIQQWHGFQPVGGYNAAFRLVEALRLLPAAVMAVTFPMLVRTSDLQLVRTIGGRLAAAGLVLAAVCGLGATAIVPLIYGESYAYAAPAFAVLSLALPLFFLNYALTHQVIGWDGQRAYLAIVTLALAGNVAANFVLVPARGIIGAAIATVLTEVIVTAGCLYTLVHHEGSSRGFNTRVQHEGSPT